MAVFAKSPVSPEAPLLGELSSGSETERLYEGNLKMKIGEPETLRLSYISVSNTFEI